MTRWSDEIKTLNMNGVVHRQMVRWSECGMAKEEGTLME